MHKWRQAYASFLLSLLPLGAFFNRKPVDRHNKPLELSDSNFRKFSGI